MISDCSQGCCKLPPEGCNLTFTYTNVNAIQDDRFDIYLIKNDGTEVYAGTIDGVCNSLQDPDNDPCTCSDVDTKTFDFTITQDFLGNNACNSCSIQFRTEMVGDNGCGTYATFDVSGPYGSGFGGYMGDSGFIDISASCIPAT